MLASLSVGLVLCSALCHAAWNAMVKNSPSKLFILFMLQLTSAVLALVAVPFVPWPSPKTLLFVALSVALHLGYNLFLVLAYRTGDLSHVYPIARGSGPMVVALASGPLVGETLHIGTWCGLLGIGLGIAVLTYRPGTKAGGRELAFALATGMFIGAYTIVDGLGVRIGDAATYIVYLFIGEGLVFSCYVVTIRREILREHFRSEWRRGVAVGVLAAAAYAVVVWAMSLHQVAFVAALRETSVVFAALIGTRLLKESFAGRRVLGATIVAVGAAVMNFYR